MIRVGLVGFGMAGRVFHAPLISSVEGLALSAVVERHTDHAKERYPWITTHRSLESMLADRTLGLIVVATPSGTHFEVAQRVLEAGFPAVVDKPLATSAHEIAALAGLAKKRGVALIPFHNRRFDGDFLTVEKLLLDGRLGRVVALESRMDRWNPGATRRAWKDAPEEGGGVLLDLGTHLVDQALALFGNPMAVSAEVLRERDGEGANDAFTVRLRYLGLRVTVEANALSSPAGARFVVRGTRGNFRKKGVDPQEAALNRITQIRGEGWGEEAASEWGMLHVDVEGGMVTRPFATLAGDYRRFYAGVRDALEGRAKPPVTAADAWRVARVLEWAMQSAEKHCEVECNWKGEPA
ncbi:oxidoreductase [Acidobacteria bacterium AB60]|nr:oxidoreductase [Acidobacteria bacterium AB60]